MMAAEGKLRSVLDHRLPNRVPVAPKIWVDLGAALTGTPLTSVISDPLVALRVIARAGVICKADAVRQFHFPQRSVETDGERVYEINKSRRRIGEIDMLGGLSTRLFEPETFELENPMSMAWHHYYAAAAPFVKDESDVKSIAVPGKEFYHEAGCAARQQLVTDEFSDKLEFIGDLSSATLAFHACLRGLDRALVDLVDSPSFVHRVMEKGAAIAIEKGKFNIDLGLKILRLNDSIANMNVISPRLFRDFVFPHMKYVCEELHRYHPDARIYCHICGNILPIADDLVETGLDCIGPLDPLGGMSAAQVRDRVGSDMVLMGGVNTLSFLGSSDADVIDESKRCIKAAGVGGRYILGSGCVIPRHAAPDRIRSLRTAAEKFGRYEDGLLVEQPAADEGPGQKRR
jgi:uroporphyrinogen-III decarboxylase